LKSEKINNAFNRIRLFRHSKKESYLVLNKILGFYPNKIELYEEALIHKSFNQSTKHTLCNNERLEFLGDAVLGAIVTDVVYQRYPKESEGFLTNMRSKIIRRESLDKISKDLGLDSLVLSSFFSQKNHVLGNALEALIGAIYLDKGYKRTSLFVEEKIITPYIDFKELSQNNKNAKSQLLEWGQQKKIPIEFDLVNSCQKDKITFFESVVLISGIPAGEGTGSSKKDSQQKAAQMALEKIETDEEFQKEIEIIQLQILDSLDSNTPI